jgi:hypothetical protein
VSKVAVSFMACPTCGQPHDRREACSTERVGHTEEVTSGTIRNRARRRRGPKFTFKLTKAQRRELFAGHSPRLAVPKGKSPFAPGDVYAVPGSTRLWLGITGIEEGKEEDTILYTLYDDHPRLLRASVHGVDFDAIRRSLDSKGRAKPMRDPAAIADAAEDSAYTSSPGASLRLEKEAVSRDVQDQLTRESAEDRRLRRQQAIARFKGELARIEDDPDFSGQTADTKYFRRKVERWEEEDDTEKRAA